MSLAAGQSSATLSGAAVAMQCCPSHAPGFRTNQVCLYLTIALEGETCKTDIATFDAILDIEKSDPLCGSYAVHWRTDFSVQGPVHAPDSYESLFNPDGGDTQTRNCAIGLSLISALYGCLHLSAWSSHFPTTVEMWMWRAACTTVAVTLLCFFFTFWGLNKVAPSDDENDDDNRPDPPNRCRSITGYTLASVACVAALVLSTVYPCGRLYIIAEVLASLRSPPLGGLSDR